jgi:hypothetical protein
MIILPYCVTAMRNRPQPRILKPNKFPIRRASGDVLNQKNGVAWYVYRVELISVAKPLDKLLKSMGFVLNHDNDLPQQYGH